MNKKKILKNKGLIKCTDCVHRYRKIVKDFQWCNISNQYNWNGACKYFKKFTIRI